MLHRLTVFAAAALLVGACASPKPHIHFASASEQQLNTASDEETWFEFRPGDEVPIAFLYKGVIEASTPVKAKAIKQFWLVFRPKSPPRFSFDGESIASDAGSAGVLVGRDPASTRSTAGRIQSASQGET